MGDFTAGDRKMLQETHDSIIEFNVWRLEHEKAHIADAKAYLKVFEISDKRMDKQSKEIRTIDGRTIYALAFIAGAVGILYLLEKIGVL